MCPVVVAVQWEEILFLAELRVKRLAVIQNKLYVEKHAEAE